MRVDKTAAWLVTGGAGYIGSHVVAHLRNAGHRVVVFDNLATGVAGRLSADVPLVVGDVSDTAALQAALRCFRITGVAHLAARKSVAESVRRRRWYYEQNVGGVVQILRAMTATGVRRLLFSSSAAVYGNVTTPLVHERTAAAPINAYGTSKLIGERMIAAAGGQGLSWIALRFFNVLGSEIAGSDGGPHSLMAGVLDAARTLRPFTVTGTDFATSDGTGVRDYVHVADIAAAHTAAVARLLRAPAAGQIYNVGSGCGHSVLDVLGTVERVCGSTVPWVPMPRRPGDPAAVVADARRIAADLGWRARHDLEEMVRSAWRSQAEPAVAS